MKLRMFRMIKFIAFCAIKEIAFSSGIRVVANIGFLKNGLCLILKIFECRAKRINGINICFPPAAVRTMASVFSIH